METKKNYKRPEFFEVEMKRATVLSGSCANDSGCVPT